MGKIVLDNKNVKKIILDNKNVKKITINSKDLSFAKIIKTKFGFEHGFFDADYVLGYQLLVNNQDDNTEFASEFYPNNQHYRVQGIGHNAISNNTNLVSWNKFCIIRNPRRFKKINLRFRVYATHVASSENTANEAGFKSYYDKLFSHQNRQYDASPFSSKDDSDYVSHRNFDVTIELENGKWIYKSIKVGSIEYDYLYISSGNKSDFRVPGFNNYINDTREINNVTPFINHSYNLQQQVGIIIKESSWIKNAPQAGTSWKDDTTILTDPEDIVVSLMPRYDNLSGEQGVCAIILYGELTLYEEGSY